MTIHEEIIELEDSLNENPNSNRLRSLLINKMKSVTGYEDKVEFHIKEYLKLDPDNINMKNLLARIFYQNKKYSACIILAEELMDDEICEEDTMVVLSKAYLNEGNHGRSREIYEEIIEHNPAFGDIELNQAFKVAAGGNSFSDNTSFSFMEKPNVKFNDVGGLEGVKREIDLKIIKPLQFQDLYKSYGKKTGGGILLYGPPGCGKTFIAKATAGEINSGFINVTLNDILDMWIGNSEKNLNRIFNEARKNKPCVLFFDEVDALGSKRSDMKESAGKNVINQFLSEMDGVEVSNDGVLTIGATNVPWHIDAAFRRPGRFDRIIFVPPPDTTGREAILKLIMKSKPQSNVDYALIAKSTNFFSGADLNAVVDVAIEKIIEEAINTGVQRNLETKDLLHAAKERKPSTLEWFNTAKNYATFANQSGQYNDILQYLKENKL